MFATLTATCFIATSLFLGSSGAGAATTRLEMENLRITGSSGETTTLAVTACPGVQCEVFNANGVNDWVSYAVPIAKAGAYNVKIAVKKFPTRGTFQLSIKGDPVPGIYDGSYNNHGAAQDLYAPASTYADLNIGTVNFASAGTKQFKFTVVRKNAASSGYTLGFDSILLTPQTSTTTTTAKPTTTTSRPTTTTARPTTSTTAPAPSPSGFTHPGIVNSKSQLDFVKAKVAANQEPWTTAYSRAKTSFYGKMTWTPKPVAIAMCGAYNNPDIGCTAQTDDANAAYTQALLWYISGDRAHANKSIEIINAWSSTLKENRFDTTNYQNGLLVSAWSTEAFTKAAEILRYTNSGWTSTDIAKFESLLRNVYLPKVKNGWTYCCFNWQVSMAEATMNIGIFTNDRAVFEDGLGDWRNHVPAGIYLKTDGPKPIIPKNTIITPEGLDKYWRYPSAYVDGLGPETCRDMGHVGMSYGALLNAAETARIQGVDLYGEQARRITTGMEYTARFINNVNASGWVCPEPVVVNGANRTLTYEIGYNHYVGRMGMSLPETKKLLSASRPTSSGLFMNWETLTHSKGSL